MGRRFESCRERQKEKTMTSKKDFHPDPDKRPWEYDCDGNPVVKGDYTTPYPIDMFNNKQQKKEAEDQGEELDWAETYGVNTEDIISPEKT